MTDFNLDGQMYSQSILKGPNDDYAICFNNDTTLSVVLNPFRSTQVEILKFNSAGQATATSSYASTGSRQTYGADLNLSGTGLGHAGGYFAGLMGNVFGPNTLTSVTTGNTTAGVVGKYTVSDNGARTRGYNSHYPCAGVVGEMASSGDAGVVSAISEGDTAYGTVKPNAFFQADWQASTSSQYNFSIDLKGNTHAGEGGMVVMPDPQNAAIQFANGTWLVMSSAAITANVTTTTAPLGSIGFTSNATGATRTFKSDGAKWQVTA